MYSTPISTVGAGVACGRFRPFPVELLGVEAGLQAVWPVDPGAVAIGEGGPVIGLAPHQQAAGGLLEGVAVLRIETLVFQAVSDLVRPFRRINQRLESGKAENELAFGRRRRRRQCQQHDQAGNDERP